MCGFIIVIGKNENLKKINGTLLKHRGPDFNEEINLKWARLRHWRLSIQDLSIGSNQPMSDDLYSLVYNGEFYDYKSLSRDMYGRDFSSDTKLLFHALKNNDFHHLKYQSGFYSFLFLNKIEETVFAARDVFGKKPLYYYLDEKIFVLGSEETAVRKVCSEYDITLPVRKKSILHYIRYKDLHFGYTFFQGISEVPPGCSLKFSRNTWQLALDGSWKKYYTDKPFYKSASVIDQYKVLDYPDNEEDLISFLKRAIKKRFVSDVPIQLALSGGVDSTLISIIAKEDLHADKINCAITVVSDLRPSEEVKSKSLCEFLNIRQCVLDFTEVNVLKELESAVQAQGGPVSHPHALAYNILTREAKSNGKVLVTGEGADELFFGYEHYKDKSGNSTIAFLEHLKIEDFFEQDGVQSEMISADRHEISNLLFNNADNDERDLDVKTHLLSLLRRNDRIGMNNSVEVRAAFLDPELFIAVSKIQTLGTLKEGKSLLVDIIKRSYPSYSVDKTKIGFYVPFDRWFISEYQNNFKVTQYVDTAISYIEHNFSLKLKPSLKIEGKVAWALLNTGIFIDTFGKVSEQ